MKLIVCLSNHYYDADEYSMCPYCAEMVAMNGGSMFYYEDDEDYDDYYEEDYYEEEETDEIEEESQNNTVIPDTESSNAETPIEETPIEEVEPKAFEQETPVATPPQYAYTKPEEYSYYNAPVEREKKGFFSSLFNKGKKNTPKSSSPSYMESWRGASNSAQKNSSQNNIPDYLKNINQKKEARKKLNSINVPDFVKGKSTPIQDVTETKSNINIEPQIEKVEEVNAEPVATIQEQKVEEVNAEPVATIQEQKVEEVNAEPVATTQEQKVEEVNAEPVAIIQEPQVEEINLETNLDEVLDVDEFINSIDISDEKDNEPKPTPQTGMSFSDSIADFLNRNLPNMENINTDLIGKVSADEEELEEEPEELTTPNEDMSFSEQIADFLKKNLPDMEGIDTDKIGRSSEEIEIEQAQENSQEVLISEELEEEINSVINNLEILDEQPLTVGWLVCINTDLKGESYTLINSENNLDRIIGGLLSKNINTSILFDEETNSLFIESNGESQVAINEVTINDKTPLNSYDRITIQETQSKKIELLFVSLCGDKFSW